MSFRRKDFERNFYIVNTKTQTMSEKMKVPGWFWAIAIVMLIWNLLGVLAFFGDYVLTHSEEMMSVLPENQQDLYNSRAGWYTPAFAIGVFFGLLGCITLIMRRKISFIFFVISLIGVALSNIHNFGIQKMHQAMEMTGGQYFATALVILIAIFLVWFSSNCKKKGWLR